ncbi:MAG: hypothetical protein K0Q87_4614 [Neobacillus sp.]|nr:hypothetical protein [Neobacillus sp.]
MAHAYLHQEEMYPVSIITQVTERLNLGGESIKLLENKYIINFEAVPNNNAKRILNLPNSICLVVDLNENNVELMQ